MTSPIIDAACNCAVHPPKLRPFSWKPWYRRLNMRGGTAALMLGIIAVDVATGNWIAVAAGIVLLSLMLSQ